MTDTVREAWLAHEETRKTLNAAVNAKFKVGQRVMVLWGKDWRHATISWVPYENGPPATHIYVMIPGHKESKKFYMGGGVFDGIRTGDYDGVGL